MTFREYLIEAGGETGWKMELVKTSLEDARDFAVPLFEKFGRDLYKEIPNFDENYLFAQKKAKLGKLDRKDMPVVPDTKEDIKELQKHLKNGLIDINKPYSKPIKGNDPFPQGLSGKEAEEWLHNGLRDGAKKDDTIKVTKEKIPAQNLKILQSQIYFDKSITSIAQFGAKGTKDFLKSTFFVISRDNFVLDGNHRFLSTMLLEPTFKVTGIKIDLNQKELHPLLLSYSDSQGNERNV